MGVPFPDPDTAVNRLVYDQFVPAELPDLAEIEGLAPAWLSIHFPPEPDLLKPAPTADWTPPRTSARLMVIHRGPSGLWRSRGLPSLGRAP